MHAIVAVTSSRRSEPARSTSTSEAGAGGRGAAGGDGTGGSSGGGGRRVSGVSTQIACERDERALLAVAAVRRVQFASRSNASAATTLPTSCSRNPTT